MAPEPDDAELYFPPKWGTDDVAAQLRASLERQRRAGVPFPLAYKLAVARIKLPHEWSARQIWRDRAGHGLLSDPWLIGAWKAAYERRPGPADHVAVLAAALADREHRASGFDSAFGSGRRVEHQAAVLA